MAYRSCNKSRSFPCKSKCSHHTNNELSHTTTIFTFTIQNHDKEISHCMQVLGDQLYKSIIVEDYEDAVAKSLCLNQDDNSQVIINTVDRLLTDNKRNVVEFAYKLWNMFGKDIVKDCFPTEFRLLCNEDKVIFINKKYEVPITIIEEGDENNDKLAFGHETNKQLECILKPIWEDNRVYFKIFGTLHHQYLKLGDVLHDEGNAVYLGDEYKTYNQQWHLQPVMYKGDLLFSIVNRESNRVLILSDNMDEDEARLLYGPEDKFVDNPESSGWYIKQSN